MLKIFTALQLRLMDLRDREEGQTFAEYGLLLSIVAIFVIAALILFRGALTTVFNNIDGRLTSGS